MPIIEDPLIDDEDIRMATERACVVMHRGWLWMNDDERERARSHMRPRIEGAAAVFEERMAAKRRDSET